MAETLKTTATSVERVRYLQRYADAKIKADVTNNKLTISGACEKVRRQLTFGVKHTKKADAQKTLVPNIKQLPFELIDGSDVAFARWDPVICNRPVLSNDPADQASGGASEFVLDEAKLEIGFESKDLKGLANRRVLASTRCDLFAVEVPAGVIRRTLQTAAGAKEFQFLFTTANPARLQEFSWEENTLAGVSIFEQRDVAAAEKALLKMENLGKWLVVEQLTMELTFKHLDQLDWLVVRHGAGVPGAAPDPHAMKSLLRQAWEANCPVLFEQGITFRPTDPPRSSSDGKATPAKNGKKQEGKTRE